MHTLHYGLTAWKIGILAIIAVVLFVGVGRIWPRGPGGASPA